MNFRLADRYGLLVWQDFWITGDTQGGFKGSADWPLEAHVFLDNVASTIYRIRNHPGLLVGQAEMRAMRGRIIQRDAG